MGTVLRFKHLPRRKNKMGIMVGLCIAFIAASLFLGTLVLVGHGTLFFAAALIFSQVVAVVAAFGLVWLIVRWTFKKPAGTAAQFARRRGSP